jgi:anti-sigma B factor antagonist
MFSISVDDKGEILLSGRFDASQVGAASEVFDKLTETATVNFKDLDYISSAGLGVLLKTQKRLGAAGNGLVLMNMNKLVRDVFRIARFDVIFKIEEGAG